MRSWFRVILVLGLLCTNTWICFAQKITGDEYLKAREERFKMIDQQSPELAAFERRLVNIQIEVRSIVQEYKEGVITKEEAKTKLTPLLQEEHAIKNSCDYTVARQLFRFLAPRHPHGRSRQKKR